MLISFTLKFFADNDLASTMPVKPETTSKGSEITPLIKPETKPLLASVPIVLASIIIASARVKY